MTRKQALIAIRAAGSQNDQQTFLRIYTENRIAYGAAKEAFNVGRRLSAPCQYCGQAKPVHGDFCDRPAA